MKNFTALFTALLLIFGSASVAFAQDGDRGFLLGASANNFTNTQMLSVHVGGIELERESIISLYFGTLWTGNRFSTDVIEIGGTYGKLVSEDAFVRGSLGLRVFGDGDANNPDVVGGLVGRSADQYLTGSLQFGAYLFDRVAPYVQVGTATNFTDDAVRAEYGAGVLFRLP